jgi:hypothetical protein
MTTSTWFDDLPVIGKLPPEKAAAKLREFGESEAADALESVPGAEKGVPTFRGMGRLWPFQDKPWQHTAHAFGYLAPIQPGGGPQPIQYAGNTQPLPGPSLKDARIKITLDGLRVAAYPGGGTHRVLFDFYAQNQVPGSVENLHFNATYRIREGERAAILGFPIFVGLNVGGEGVAFKCFTVNVQNDQDERFLACLESDAFRNGLKLATTMQPAIAPLSEIAVGLTRAIASRNRNVPVQDFFMGLDFSAIATRARLAEGSYIAVQIPEKLQTVWDWSEWVYNPNNGQIVNKTDATQLIPYNYIVFGVSRYEQT